MQKYPENGESVQLIEINSGVFRILSDSLLF
ncbi:hypothetical protein GGQ95_000823 [Anoxybacillus rupiensis]|nr:hypothetical protein [Anoxybacillus rupiensis]